MILDRIHLQAWQLGDMSIFGNPRHCIAAFAFSNQAYEY